MYGKLYIGDKGYIPCLEVNKDGNPVGTVITFAGTTAPKGYLLCDGRDVSRTIYSDLFSVIGTTYGPGDGSSSFNLPDYSYERYVVDSKSPSGDFLTWYRLYNDGWVEEGGFISVSGCGGSSTVQVGEPTFHFTQIDQNYNLHFDFVKSGAYWSWVELTCYKVSNNKIHLEIYNNNSNKWTASTGNGVYWGIAGMSTESSVNKPRYIKF